MHIPRRPAETVEVDWAGDPAHVIDPDTDELTEAYLFVATLSYSQYTYVEAFSDEKTKNWIRAHVHMYDYFGGVTTMLVPDNSTTAVNHSRSDWYTALLNLFLCKILSICAESAAKYLSSRRNVLRAIFCNSSMLNRDISYLLC